MQTIWESLGMKPEQYREMDIMERSKLYADWIDNGHEAKVWEFAGYFPFEFSKKLQDPDFRANRFREFKEHGFRVASGESGIYMDGHLRPYMEDEKPYNTAQIFDRCFGTDQLIRLKDEEQKRKSEGNWE
jgi:hypothetical protein